MLSIKMTKKRGKIILKFFFCKKKSSNITEMFMTWIRFQIRIFPYPDPRIRIKIMWIQSTEFLVHTPINM